MLIKLKKYLIFNIISDVNVIYKETEIMRRVRDFIQGFKDDTILVHEDLIRIPKLMD